MVDGVEARGVCGDASKGTYHTIRPIRIGNRMSYELYTAGTHDDSQTLLPTQEVRVFMDQVEDEEDRAYLQELERKRKYGSVSIELLLFPVHI